MSTSSGTDAIAAIAAIAQLPSRARLPKDQGIAAAHLVVAAAQGLGPGLGLVNLAVGLHNLDLEMGGNGITGCVLDVRM